MSHSEKVDYFIDDMRRRGIKPSSVAPPLFRMLWALGLKVPPPLFWGFAPLALFMGVLFGFLWGVLMAIFFMIWHFWAGTSQGRPLGELLLTGAIRLALVAAAAAVAGVLFGLCMATVGRWKAAKLELPGWEEYPDGEAAGDF
jgi:hypothetical protein